MTQVITITLDWGRIITPAYSLEKILAKNIDAMARGSRGIADGHKFSIDFTQVLLTWNEKYNSPYFGSDAKVTIVKPSKGFDDGALSQYEAACLKAFNLHLGPRDLHAEFAALIKANS